MAVGPRVQLKASPLFTYLTPSLFVVKKVFYMTCMQEDKVKGRMEDTKADGYILKPFEYDDIAKLMDEYIPPKTN